MTEKYHHLKEQHSKCHLLREEINHLQKDLEEFEHLKDDHHHLQEEHNKCAHLDQEVHTLEEKLSMLQKNYDESKVNFNVLVKEHHALKESCQEHKGEEKNWKDKFFAKEEECHGLRQHLYNSEQKCKHLMTECNRIRKESHHRVN